MRVERKKAGKARTFAAPEKRSATVRKPDGQFQTALLTKQHEHIREQLVDLIVKIDAQAKEIEHSLTFEALAAYRELVQKFIVIAVNELYEVEEKLSISQSGKTKSMIIVKKINTALEDMTDQFLGRQMNLLNFLGRLDEIRGLLMDLYT